jgi:single-strand DNA-binding protein
VRYNMRDNMRKEFCNVSLCGTLTRDPELKQYDSGAKKCHLNIAVVKQFTKRSGDIGNDTCFIDADVWGDEGITYSQSLRKGDQVLIDGSLRYEKWIDKKDGTNRSCHKVKPEKITVVKAADETDTIHKQPSTSHMPNLDLSNSEDEHMLQQLEEMKMKILQRTSGAKPISVTGETSNQSKQAPAMLGDELPF